MRPRLCRQRDLFKEAPKTSDLSDTQRNLLVRLIECLLVEALADGAKTAAANLENKEAAHDQDHA